ncbi:MAG: GHKL domain-containing protein [Fusobacteria bacterium]|nr:GHKL domain-containing protein [Fusobacteriota bacterium]
MKKSMIKNKLILILILFSSAIITIIIGTLYYNLIKTIRSFNSITLESNKSIIKEMLTSGKDDVKDMIISINSGVLTKTKSKIDDFVSKASKDNNYVLLEIFSKSIENEFKFIEIEITEILNRTEFKWGIEYGERAVLGKKLGKNSIYEGFLIYHKEEGNPVKVGNIEENRITKTLYRTIGDTRINYSQIQNNDIIYLGAIINDEEGNYSGYMISKIDIKKVFNKFFKEIDLGAEKAFFIVKSNSIIMKHKNQNKEGKRFDDIDLDSDIFSKNSNLYQKIMGQNIYTLYKYNYKNIIFYIVSHEYISDAFSNIDLEKFEQDVDNMINDNFGEYDKKIEEKIVDSYLKSSEVSKEKLTDFKKNLFTVVEFIAFLGIAISIVIGIIIANYISDPINKLTFKVKKIGGENFDEEIDESLLKRKDEIGELAKEFNEMNVRIKEDIMHIKELERRKALSERLSVMGEMVSGIVHEIKNPLTSISGFAQIIESVTEDSMIKKHSKTIVDESMRLNKLTRNLLSYAKVEKLERENANIELLIKNIAEKLYPELREKKLKIVINFSENEIFTNVDKDKMTQVFMNIISNSIEAVEEETGVIMIVGDIYEKNLFIKIRDNGPGMSNEVKKRLFMPFVTTKKGGTGLGLAMVKKIIDDHNGDIYINEELITGTEFIIKLPL